MLEDSDIIKKIEEEFSATHKDDWQQIARQSLKGKPLDKISSLNYEGINVQPVYSKEDVEITSQFFRVPPGEFPFTRGKELDGYRKQPWYISQTISVNNAREFNLKLKDNLSRGQTAVTLRIGEGKREKGEGRKSITNYELRITNFFPKNSTEFKIAFDGIDLKNLPFNLFAGQNALEELEVFNKYLEENNLNWTDIQGGIDFDPIGNLVSEGNLNYSLESAFEDLKKFLKKKLNPHFQPVTISGLPYREGGANAVQELAFTLATAVNYIRLLCSNVSIDEIAPKIRFVLTTGSDFFVEIAKIRAMRVLWANIIMEFGGNEDSQKLNLYVRSLEMNKSNLDVYVNLLRNTTEALAGIIGGCDTIEINSQFTIHNSQLSENLEFSERVTRNTQLVLAEECMLKEVSDPAGGSYYIEELTSEIAKKSWGLFQDVEKRGGILEALKLGFPQDEVAKIRTERIKNLATRKDVVLGANKYPNLKEEFTIHNSQFTINEEKGKREMGEEIVNKNSQIPKPNTLYPKPQIVPIPSFRTSAVFESLRMKAIEFQEKTGRSPKVFIGAMGPLSKHKARVDFTTDVLHVGGIEVDYNDGFSAYEDTAKGFLESGLNVIVFCSSDDIYPEFVPQLARLIKRGKPFAKIILAGYPTDKIEEYKNAGVDEFIHIKADIVKVLEDIYSDLI